VVASESATSSFLDDHLVKSDHSPILPESLPGSSMEDVEIFRSQALAWLKWLMAFISIFQGTRDAMAQRERERGKE
jgi:hypothetical protein